MCLDSRRHDATLSRWRLSRWRRDAATQSLVKKERHLLWYDCVLDPEMVSLGTPSIDPGRA
jgi:hypothetical protein